MCKSSTFFYVSSLFIQLHITKVRVGSESGENFPDPVRTEKVRIRPELEPQPWTQHFSFLPTSTLSFETRESSLTSCSSTLPIRLYRYFTLMHYIIQAFSFFPAPFKGSLFLCFQNPAQLFQVGQREANG